MLSSEIRVLNVIVVVYIPNLKTSPIIYEIKFWFLRNLLRVAA